MQATKQYENNQVPESEISVLMENCPSLRLSKIIVSWVMGTKYWHTSNDGMLLSAFSYFYFLVLYTTLRKSEGK